jgi:pyridoxal phosphate enzyme (YggS family)
MDALIRDNFQAILERITIACRQSGRQDRDVKLVVVTKGQPAEKVRSVVEAGATRLGENYAEEAVEKMSSLSLPHGVEWHMIGHVQSRKARLVCDHFAWLHSLDSLKLALRLDRFLYESGRELPVLLECNMSGEESKFGFSAWRDDHWPQLFEELETILTLSRIQVHGLMTMAPYFQDPEQARPFFRRLVRLRDELRKRFPRIGWDELSMGMSADFVVAVQEGATIIRIGEAILGPRPKRGA